MDAAAARRGIDTRFVPLASVCRRIENGARFGRFSLGRGRPRRTVGDPRIRETARVWPGRSTFLRGNGNVEKRRSERSLSRLRRWRRIAFFIENTKSLLELSEQRLLAGLVSPNLYLPLTRRSRTCRKCIQVFDFARSPKKSRELSLFFSISPSFRNVRSVRNASTTFFDSVCLIERRRIA